jgi:hypothetical protein
MFSLLTLLSGDASSGSFAALGVSVFLGLDGSGFLGMADELVLG